MISEGGSCHVMSSLATYQHRAVERLASLLADLLARLEQGRPLGVVVSPHAPLAQLLQLLLGEAVGGGRLVSAGKYITGIERGRWVSQSVSQSPVPRPVGIR